MHHAERYSKILPQTGAKSITISYNIFVYNSKRQQTGLPTVFKKDRRRQEPIVSPVFSSVLFRQFLVKEINTSEAVT